MEAVHTSKDIKYNLHQVYDGGSVLAWTRSTQLIIACIIGGIIGIFCSLFFNNILWVPLLIMVAGLVSLFCKPAAEIPPKEETKFSSQ